MKTYKDKAGLVTTISGVLAKENVRVVSMREHIDSFNDYYTANYPRKSLIHFCRHDEGGQRN